MKCAIDQTVPVCVENIKIPQQCPGDIWRVWDKELYFQDKCDEIKWYEQNLKTWIGILKGYLTF